MSRKTSRREFAAGVAAAAGVLAWLPARAHPDSEGMKVVVSLGAEEPLPN